MLSMVAIAGPQGVGSWLQRGDVVDVEKIFGGKRQVQVLGVGLRGLEGGLRERGNLFKVTGLNVSCVKAAPQCFRVAALPEDGVTMETAMEADESAVGVPVYEGPTVKVKFELHRECHFGQQFKVVGGDAQFGDWNPSAALPLNWTEGHLWTTEVDVPEGKNFEYKYILVSGQEGEEVEWQPGSNHVLETVAAAPSLVISEPWEDITQSAESTSEQLEVQPAEPEVRSDELAESATGDWEAVSENSEVNTPVEKLADGVASAAAGALNVGVKAATGLGKGLDAVLPVSDGETNGVSAESEDETPTAVEIPVVDAALAAAAEAAPVTATAPATPAEEFINKNGDVSTMLKSQAETVTKEQPKMEKQPRMEDQQPTTEEQTIVEEQQSKKSFNPFQKDFEWLSKTLFGR